MIQTRDPGVGGAGSETGAGILGPRVCVCVWGGASPTCLTQHFDVTGQERGCRSLPLSHASGAERGGGGCSLTHVRLCRRAGRQAVQSNGQSGGKFRARPGAVFFGGSALPEQVCEGGGRALSPAHRKPWCVVVTAGPGFRPVSHACCAQLGEWRRGVQRSPGGCPLSSRELGEGAWKKQPRRQARKLTKEARSVFGIKRRCAQPWPAGGGARRQTDRLSLLPGILRLSMEVLTSFGCRKSSKARRVIGGEPPAY